MFRAFAIDGAEKRKLRFMYNQSGIAARYSVLPDFSLPADEWQFFPPTENLEPFPALEDRMEVFRKYAAPLSFKAIQKCLAAQESSTVGIPSITHLITVSCTGMSAPGLDLELIELLGLKLNTWRTSINFMGCYAAIHALKIADAICTADKNANVLIVCLEFCTLHFQKDLSEDNITSSLLFGDGAAAVLVSGKDIPGGLNIDHFYSSVSLKGKQDMAWQMSSKGYLMTLSGYIPALIEEDFNSLVEDALSHAGMEKEAITHWCIHPGGKKVLEAVHKSLGFTNGQLQEAYDVLQDYGNMSSPTILFVLERLRKKLNAGGNNKIFGAAFGPGLTMETFIVSG
jgi:predicted naringenin-chalcone synthase